MRLRPLIFTLLALSSALAGDLESIASVIQRGSFLYVYNAKGSQLSTIAAGDGLVGYTGSSINVRKGNFIYIFDARGRQTGVVAAK
jgi:hypothetical protein